MSASNYQQVKERIGLATPTQKQFFRSSSHSQSIVSFSPRTNQSGGDSQFSSYTSKINRGSSFRGSQTPINSAKKVLSMYESGKMTPKSGVAFEYVPHCFSSKQVNLEQKMRMDEKVMSIFDRLGQNRAKIELRKSEKQEIIKNYMAMQMKK